VCGTVLGRSREEARGGSLRRGCFIPCDLIPCAEKSWKRDDFTEMTRLPGHSLDTPAGRGRTQEGVVAAEWKVDSSSC
jgi:hypothetical protein